MSGLRLQARLAERGAEFDLELSSGDVLAVLGPNGAGKSTLLSLIAGLLRPDHARIVLGDRVLTDTAAGVFVPTHQRGVAMLAQQAMLFPHLSVAANVAYGPRSQGLDKAQIRRRVDVFLSNLSGAPRTLALYEQFTLEALERGVFGAPIYWLDGERYWGQDRLLFIERKLARLRPGAGS